MPNHDYQEMQKILRLTMAQSHLALEESATAVDDLSREFVAMAETIDQLDSYLQQADNLPDETRTTLAEAIAGFRSQAQSGTVAFQFYDKFSQRMNHLITTLGDLEGLIGSGEIEDPSPWQALKESVRKRYTMEQEHRMLDAIESGASIEEAVAASAPATEDDIELF